MAEPHVVARWVAAVDNVTVVIHHLSDGSTRREEVLTPLGPEEKPADLSQWTEVGYTTDGGVFGGAEQG